MAESMWLQVEIGEGMFPNERAVSFLTSEGENVSLFVPNTQVEAPGRLRVRVLDCDARVGLVELPAQKLSGGSVVRVERERLQK